MIIFRLLWQFRVELLPKGTVYGERLEQLQRGARPEPRHFEHILRLIGNEHQRIETNTHHLILVLKHDKKLHKHAA